MNSTKYAVEILKYFHAVDTVSNIIFDKIQLFNKLENQNLIYFDNTK